MKFGELKQGHIIYILDKESVVFSTEKVNGVSMPHIDPKMSARGMVVDVTTDNNTYCVVSENDTAYPPNKVISTDKMNILHDVEATKMMSEQALSQMEYHKQTVERCTKLIADLDPSQREKQEIESRFVSMEARLDKLMQLLEKGGKS